MPRASIAFDEVRLKGRHGHGKDVYQHTVLVRVIDSSAKELRNHNLHYILNNGIEISYVRSPQSIG